MATKLDLSKLAPSPWDQVLAMVPGGNLRRLLDRLRAAGVRLVWTRRGWRLQPPEPTVAGWAALGKLLGYDPGGPRTDAAAGAGPDGKLRWRLEALLQNLNPPSEALAAGLGFLAAQRAQGATGQPGGGVRRPAPQVRRGGRVTLRTG